MCIRMQELEAILHAGVNVNIKRTDGRVHSAVISAYNANNNSVTVEWFEKGETKGKEIEVDAILELNTEIAQKLQSVQPLPTRIAKLPVRASINIPSAALKARKTISERPVDPLSNSYRGVTGRPGLRGRQSFASQPTVNQLSSNGHDDYSNGSEATNNNGGGTINKNPVSVNSRRRSNVVKEVEKLKKNREERRAKQAEKKIHKEELMNLDPGNPNWETIAMIREFTGNLEMRPLKDGDPLEEHQITVCVRKRPLNKKEKGRKEFDLITVPNRDQIVVHEPKAKVDLTKYLDNQCFRFDYVFDDTATNDLVYKYSAKPLVHTIFEGGMATCFAYGQTGSGKTHTMGGDFIGKNQECSKGIYALAAKDVFKHFHSPKYKTLDLIVSSSFFEIYSGKVFDLLNGKVKLRVLEDGKKEVQVVGLTERPVESVEDVLKLIHSGNTARTSGQTSANVHSSRSHAVFQIILRNKHSLKLYGKFSLIDLAGNERGADTSSANRQIRMEGAEINKSLLALKECIRALGRKGAHLPFRASKLTQVLRDSFIGDKSRTCMIAMISPGNNSCEHTLNTLRYADRVKELGAQDPLEVRPSVQVEFDKIDECSTDDDLAQLRSLNEGELSVDLLHLQEAISHVQDIEDFVLENHGHVIEMSHKWLELDRSLLSMSNEVGYDVDAYVQQVEDLLLEKIEILSKFKENVADFRVQLAEEEKISKAIKK